MLAGSIPRRRHNRINDERKIISIYTCMYERRILFRTHASIGFDLSPTVRRVSIIYADRFRANIVVERRRRVEPGANNVRYDYAKRAYDFALHGTNPPAVKCTRARR